MCLPSLQFKCKQSLKPAALIYSAHIVPFVTVYVTGSVKVQLTRHILHSEC
eukprot:m.17802 g.17802  ORF g.17802 m.17802 type:complete len:51 (-) comp6114_c0_seq1:173-325(-)